MSFVILVLMLFVIGFHLGTQWEKEQEFWREMEMWQNASAYDLLEFERKLEDEQED